MKIYDEGLSGLERVSRKIDEAMARRNVYESFDYAEVKQEKKSVISKILDFFKFKKRGLK